MDIKLITFKVDAELHRQVRIRAAELDSSIKAYITSLIKKDLQKEKE